MERVKLATHRGLSWAPPTRTSSCSSAHPNKRLLSKDELEIQARFKCETEAEEEELKVASLASRGQQRQLVRSQP